MRRTIPEVFAEIETCLQRDLASAGFTSPLSVPPQSKIAGSAPYLTASGEMVASFARMFPNLRTLLSGFSPKYVLSLLFSARYTDIRPDKVRALADRFGSPPMTLIDLIYGEAFGAVSLPFLRFPSRCKREIVKGILSNVRMKLPWLNSRLLHCMAFRPEAFDRKEATADDDWGPLYRRVYLDKGSRRKRYLDVPNYPLKVIQSALLRTVLNHRLAPLPDCVFGFRPGKDCNIFAHARAHLGRAVAVSFDIKDFFPSIGINQVIQALMQRRLELTLPQAEGGETRVVRIDWAHDAALLIAKLTTYHGRLPQGAPSSPALSNIVFAPVDQELQSWARSRRLLYTRYADDMTLSASASQFKTLFNEDPKRFRKDVADAVAGILRQHGFTLEHFKLAMSFCR